MAQPTPRIPVIIDTDPGVDDILSILLALASPEIEILGYVVSYGNTDVDPSIINLFKAYQAVTRHIEACPEDATRFPGLSSLTKPFVVRGASAPLQGDMRTAQYFHGRDGLCELSKRHADVDCAFVDGAPSHPQLVLTHRNASEVVLDVLSERPARTVTYIALGPLTNLALTMREDSTTVRERIGRVVCMGGALDVPGNTGPVSEFNFFADPFAVRELLAPSTSHNGLPLSRFIMLPLDITTPHELRFLEYCERVDGTFHSAKRPSRAEGKQPMVHFTSSFLERTREIMLGFGNDAVELHDPVAVWCALSNPPIAEEKEDMYGPIMSGAWRVTRRKFEIERFGELTRGMLVVDRRADDSNFSLGAVRSDADAEKQRAYVVGHALTNPESGSGQHDSLGGHAQAIHPASLTTPVSTDSPLSTNGSSSASAVAGGVACVVETPGAKELVELMFARVWGA